MESHVDFSALAPVYHLLESLVFGGALQRRRCAFLQQITGGHRVLILGDGDGRFSAEYARLNPRSLLHIVDVSPGMQRIAKEHFSRQNLSSEFVTWTVADAKSLAFETKYDLVVTHFFLDCFSDSELQMLVPRIANAMTADGRWLVSEFQIPPKGLPRLLGAILVRAMYSFFRLFAGLRTQRLPLYEVILQANNFQCVKRETAGRGLLVSEIWQATPVNTENERSLLSAQPDV